MGLALGQTPVDSPNHDKELAGVLSDCAASLRLVSIQREHTSVLVDLDSRCSPPESNTTIPSPETAGDERKSGIPPEFSLLNFTTTLSGCLGYVTSADGQIDPNNPIGNQFVQLLEELR